MAPRRTWASATKKPTIADMTIMCGFFIRLMNGFPPVWLFWEYPRRHQKKLTAVMIMIRYPQVQLFPPAVPWGGGAERVRSKGFVSKRIEWTPLPAGIRVCRWTPLPARDWDRVDQGMEGNPMDAVASEWGEWGARGERSDGRAGQTGQGDGG